MHGSWPTPAFKALLMAEYLCQRTRGAFRGFGVIVFFRPIRQMLSVPALLPLWTAEPAMPVPENDRKKGPLLTMAAAILIIGSALPPQKQ